ncbi:UBX domain protein Ubx2 [Umbelopsis nana]
MDDEKIINFCAVTSCAPDIAQSYLQVSEWNVETALSLYFENSGAPLGPPEPIPESENPYSQLHDSVDDSDEAFARQLQEEQYSEQSDVRAPIAPTTDVLVGDEGFGHSFDRRGPLLQRHPVFNQGDSSSAPHAPEAFRNFASEMESLQGGGRSQSPVTSDKTKRLADLFRPPFDIMYQGDFESARNFAKESKKWLLVNIQDPTEFSCQVMNRDLWSEQAVKDVIKESFVFLQYGNESPEGKRYLTLYAIENYPHVAIIDARTGERVKAWNTQMSVSDFLMNVTEFLETKSSQKTPSTKRPKVVSDMTEEEQLNAAIAASLGNSNPEGQSSTAQTPSDMQDAEVDEEIAEEERQISILDSIEANKRDEPTDLKASTRIQLRLADGSRIVRRFNKTDPVRYIFEFVKAEIDEARTRPFDLVYNRQQLIDLIDKDIKEAGLENAAINFNFS